MRIIAGAGSGKTRVVTVRIAYLIDECHVYPNRILAITFTNKAAREMKERVESMLGPLAASVRISTIHSFCVRLLREDIQEIGYPRSFTILDSEDQKSILKEIYKKRKSTPSLMPMEPCWRISLRARRCSSIPSARCSWRRARASA